MCFRLGRRAGLGVVELRDGGVGGAEGRKKDGMLATVARMDM